MNNFGLGIILTFTDNATSGLKRATGAFNDLNASTAAFSKANDAEAALLQISVAAGIVGNELYQIGNSITSMFAGVTQSIINTGTTILTAKTQLGTLYGSMEEGEAKLSQIKEYAASSIFNFEDLIPSVIMLKANGIEAFDQIATSAYEATNGVEGVSQTLMDYASDLAAFNPQMRNAYGTGVQAAMGALNEYIAEGNSISLKRGASLDINQLLGEDTAGTIEERSRQVADLIEQLGMVGTTANLASTPMQRLSNVEDVLFNTMAEIANSGVYDKYAELIAKITDYIFAIPESELSNISQVVADALVEILDLLDPVVDGVIKLADAVRDFLKTNPELAKSIIKGTALAGVFMLISGAGLKLASSLGMLKFSLSTLFSGMKATNGFTLLGLFKNLFKTILPLIAVGILLREAWDRDFMSIQETVTNTVKTVWDSLKLIADAFMDSTLSEENFQKAKDMGILPLIEGILQLKYHWDFFVEGFKKGLDAFFESLSKVLVKLGILDVDVSGFGDLVVALIDKMTAPGITDTWEKVGYFLGEAVGWILVTIALLPVVIKGVKAIVSVIKTIVNVVKIVWNVFKTVWNVIEIIYYSIKTVVNVLKIIPWGTILSGAKTVFSAISKGIVLILTGIGNIVTLPAWLVGLIVVAIAAVTVAIIAFWDEIKAFFVKIGNAIAEAFTRAWEWFNNLPWVQSVVGFITSIVLVVKSAVSTIIGFVIKIISIIAPTIKNIASVIATVFMGVIDIVKTVASAIGSVLKSVFNVIKSVVMGAWNIIKSVANFVVQIFKVVYQVIRTTVLSVIWVFQQLWGAISTGLNFIYNLFSTIFNWIYSNIIEPIISAIGSAFSWLYDNVISPVINAIGVAFEWLNTNVIQPVCTFFIEAFNTISDRVNKFCDTVKSVFTTVKEWICDSIQTAADVVTPIIDKISSAISFVAEGLSSIIDAASGALSWVGEKVESAGDYVSQAVGLSTGGYVKTEGIAMLHPNEVVVNDVLTRGLGAFLDDYNKAKVTSSPLIQQDIVSTDDYSEDNNPITPKPIYVEYPDTNNNDDSPMRSIVNNSTTYSQEDNSKKDNISQDNSVTFESGSVVIQIDKDTDLSDEGLDLLVDKLMKKMARKVQLRNMQTRV